MPTRIAFFIWCQYSIYSQAEREKLTKEVEMLYAKDNNFKILCDVIFNCKLHRYEPSQLVNDLFNIQTQDLNKPVQKLKRISNLASLNKLIM